MLGYHLTRVSVAHASIGVIYSSSYSMCHVLFAMPERLLRTYPDGAFVHLSLQAIGGFRWFETVEY